MNNIENRLCTHYHCYYYRCCTCHYHDDCSTIQLIILDRILLYGYYSLNSLVCESLFVRNHLFPEGSANLNPSIKAPSPMARSTWFTKSSASMRSPPRYKRLCNSPLRPQLTRWHHQAPGVQRNWRRHPEIMPPPFESIWGISDASCHVQKLMAHWGFPKSVLPVGPNLPACQLLWLVPALQVSTSPLRCRQVYSAPNLQRVTALQPAAEKQSICSTSFFENILKSTVYGISLGVGTFRTVRYKLNYFVTNNEPLWTPIT